LYDTWYGMLYRCEREDFAGYEKYGGRGIRVCQGWHDFETFIIDIDRLLGPRPPGMTLDREDVNGNYEPGNVRWATSKQQQANRRAGTPGPEVLAERLGVSLEEAAEMEHYYLSLSSWQRVAVVWRNRLDRASSR
jgi:hypothetical protein